jgi:hypothetical protein
MQQDGLVATWGTNMDSTYAITCGDTLAMEQYDRPQSHGLREISDGLGMAYLPGQPQGDDLYLQVFVDGVRQLKHSSTVKGGSAETPTIQMTFPPEDDDLFLAAFSDIHEVNIAYEGLAQGALGCVFAAGRELVLYVFPWGCVFCGARFRGG